MITPAAFTAIYKIPLNEALFAQLSPIAETRALIFPVPYRELASQYFLGYMLCMFAGTRGPSELKAFEVKPEGYSVSYTDGGAKCDNWLELIRQLAIVAGVQLDPKPVQAEYANRTEHFYFSF